MRTAGCQHIDFPRGGGGDQSIAHQLVLGSHLSFSRELEPASIASLDLQPAWGEEGWPFVASWPWNELPAWQLQLQQFPQWTPLRSQFFSERAVVMVAYSKMGEFCSRTGVPCLITWVSTSLNCAKM